MERSRLVVFTRGKIVISMFWTILPLVKQGTGSSPFHFLFPKITIPCDTQNLFHVNSKA
jgi:hypothetical protein